MRVLRFAVLVALAGLLALPGIVSGHPLGNFTINHYAGIRVTPEAVLIDLVIDRAEIPTVAEYARLDADGDGELTDTEIETARLRVCTDLAPGLLLLVDGRSRALTATLAGLSFPPGVGGLPTMRTVCAYTAALEPALTARTEVSFADMGDDGRLGWREMTVTGDGVTIVDAPVGADGVSERLTAYPSDLLTAPLTTEAVAFSVEPGGAAAPPFVAPDARPLAASSGPVSVGTSHQPATGRPAVSPAAAIPGGIPDDLAGILADPSLGLATVVTTIVLALALGAAHALSPGHGKTVMAAYLVGARGTATQALGLGLTITVSHTTGVLVLALIVLSATSLIPPDRIVPVLTVVSGIGFVAIGLWMLAGQLTAWRRRRAHHHPHEHDLDHDHAHDPPEHAHGPIRHRHLPADDRALTWRGLIGLGLVGGLVPSVSALVLLLGSLAAGRPAYGVILVIAFGVGMAAVLAGIGLALVYGRGLLERRVRVGARVEATLDALPVVAAAVVVAAGFYVTSGALGLRL